MEKITLINKENKKVILEKKLKDWYIMESDEPLIFIVGRMLSENLKYWLKIRNYEKKEL